MVYTTVIHTGRHTHLVYTVIHTQGGIPTLVHLCIYTPREAYLPWYTLYIHTGKHTHHGTPSIYTQGGIYTP